MVNENVDVVWVKQESLDLWLPTEEGEELVGVVVDISEGSYGLQYQVKTADGTFRTPSHKVLQSRLANVEEKDEVKIVFKGEEPPSVKGQRPTKIYEVFKKKR